MKLIQLNLSTSITHEETPAVGKAEAVNDRPRKPQTFLATLISCAEEQNRNEPEPDPDPLAAALEELAAEALEERVPVTVTVQNSLPESLAEWQLADDAMQNAAFESLAAEDADIFAMLEAQSESRAEAEPAAAGIQDATPEFSAEPEPAAVTMEDAAVEACTTFKPMIVRWEELAVEAPGHAKAMAARWREVETEEVAITAEPLLSIEKPLSIVEQPLAIVEDPLPEERLSAQEPIAVKAAAKQELTPVTPAAVFIPPSIPKPGAFVRAMSWINRRTLSNTKQLRVAETVSLGEKRFVAVVHVEGRKFLIGGGASAVSLLTQLGDESGVAPLAPAALAESLQ